ncbi:methionine adenosyltransferase [Candidatus Methylomirabilis sp.]|uniref:Methionine adenosyltransferase n=1 Tax=Candidatus Methylomirabilis tolerans TaxID=3123416 RepID=A0AAJ1EKC5_9BACT|nr:methionine adenosyltransferase [Candidatus Methylomirabilis sp.]
MPRVLVQRLVQPPIGEQRIEIVERKGLGHPDSICDAVMEGVARAINAEYQQRFGRVLHNNIDKGLLVAGRVRRRLGEGCMLRPMELVIGDRATFRVGKVRVPIKEIAVEAAREWFRKSLRHVDPSRHLRYRVVLSEGSNELADIFRREGVREANDTSAAVGYAPLSETEQMVLWVERHLNSPGFKTAFPETGEDVKVMGVRADRELTLTIAMPLLCEAIVSEEAYFCKKAEIAQALRRELPDSPGLDRVNVVFNQLDREGRGLGGMYLSLLGTSAEDADSGQVGRGNRVNGLIPLNRPVSGEAAAGKNPVSHIGKIYNVLSHRMADQIYQRVGGVREVYVWLVGQIGRPIDQPWVAIQLIQTSDAESERIRQESELVIDRELNRLTDFCIELTEGKYPVC